MCIINNADTAKFYIKFQLKIIFINEIAKIAELNVIIILIHYVSALIIIIKDHKQLKLTMLS